MLNCPGGPATLRESYGLSRPALNAIASKLDAHIPALCLSWEGSMPVGEGEVGPAEARMAALRDEGRAVAVQFDRRHRSFTVTLHTGVRLVVPVRLLQGLAHAPSRALGEIEISPSGLGLHWPSIDADVYVPGLLRGVFGSADWMATLGRISPPDGSPDLRSA